MSSRTTAACVALLWMVASAAPVFAGGDPVAGRLKAETCLGCHGIEGYFSVYPTYHVPKLGGQSASYVESALKAYRAGTRQHPSMNANASTLSDQDIADIAAYVSTWGK